MVEAENPAPVELAAIAPQGSLAHQKELRLLFHPTGTKPADGHQSRSLLDWAVLLLVIVKLGWIFAAPLRSADLPLRMAQDDFYYYLKPAQNLAWLHQSTFFDHVLTNGYHPLYFLLLTAMSLFIHTLPGVFRFLWGLDLLSATVIFVAARALLRKIGGALLANGLAAIITALCVPQICDQMEVTLALPFGFLFLLVAFVHPSQLTRKRLALLGLLGALLFLSRLDAGLLVVLWALAVLASPTYRNQLSLQSILTFLGTALPLPLLYFTINRVFFHTWMPISGMAKELRHGHGFTVLLPASFSGTSQILVNVAVVSGLLALILRKRLYPREKILLFVCACTPLLFYTLEIFISDWPVWNWYFYMLRFSALGAAVLLTLLLSREVLQPRSQAAARFWHGPLPAGSVLAVSLLLLLKAHYAVDHWMVEIQHAAGILDEFAATHPGIYAMGDRAGMFAITTPSPVLQTEGLVMDKRYLEHIRAEDNLKSVLASYGVNYYVSFMFSTNDSVQTVGQCYRALEPSIAGPSTLRMQSLFCEKPLLSFKGFDGVYRVYRINPA